MFTRSFAEANSGHVSALSVIATKLLRVYNHPWDGPPRRPPRSWLALSSPACTIVNGGYYNGMDLAPAAALVDNARARTQLLRLSTQLTRKTLTGFRHWMFAPRWSLT